MQWTRNQQKSTGKNFQLNVHQSRYQTQLKASVDRRLETHHILKEMVTKRSNTTWRNNHNTHSLMWLLKVIALWYRISQWAYLINSSRSLWQVRLVIQAKARISLLLGIPGQARVIMHLCTHLTQASQRPSQRHQHKSQTKSIASRILRKKQIIIISWWRTTVQQKNVWLQKQH